MNIEAITFDLDGTLLNTIDDIADAVNATLSEFHFAVKEVDEYKYLVGDGIGTLAQKVLPKEATSDVFDPFLTALLENYKRFWDKKTQPYDGIADLLTELNKRKIPVSVLSNKPHEFTILTITRFLSQWRFAAVFGARPGIDKKPSPIASMQIAAHLGLPPAAIAHVGDTHTDIETGINAGNFTVGVTWGFRPRAELEAARAQVIIDHPMELLSVIDSQ
jgi:phosphoglycolate phosphatase